MSTTCHACGYLTLNLWAGCPKCNTPAKTKRCETCEEEYRGAECPHQPEHDAWELEKSGGSFSKLATGALKDFIDTISRDNPDIGPVDVTTQVNIRFNELADATAALRAELEKAKADTLDARDKARRLALYFDDDANGDGTAPVPWATIQTILGTY